MKKTTRFSNTLFSVAALKEAIDVFSEATKGKLRPGNLAIYREYEDWAHDALEDFFYDYQRGFGRVLFSIHGDSDQALEYSVSELNYLSQVTIAFPIRDNIEKVSSVFKKHSPICNIYELQKKLHKPTIFIGHGRSALWRDLKDHLHEKHKFEIQAYETDDRSSSYTFQNVENMVRDSSFAILILTCEDEMTNGSFRARQNVIHELGYSQAKLGRKNTLVLVEEDVDWPSNIQGIDHFYFSKGNIKEVFGDIIAALEKRTFDLQKSKVFEESA
jgi:hypothetical protein